MKRLFTLVLSFAFCMAAVAQTVNYPGNMKTGFGGPIGMGSLDIGASGTTLTFTLRKGTNNLNDAFVVYIDAVPGGFDSTGGFMDASSDIMKAISGFDASVPNRRANLTFSTGFAPEYGLAIFPNNSNGAVFVQLGTATHTTLVTPTLSNNGNNNDTTYTVSVDLALLGLTAIPPFKFIGTYISGTGYRSNEFIGVPSAPAGNIEWAPYTMTDPALMYNGTFPVTLSQFSGAYRENATVLAWTSKTESNFRSYDVQKSSNGKDWLTISSVRAANNINGASYTYTDRSSNGTAYYRLKMIDNDGSFKYSNIIKMDKNTVGEIRLMGNPVKNEIRLNITNGVAAKMTFNLYTMEGRNISSVNYNHAGGVSSVVIPAANGTKGMYMLRVSNGTDQKTIPVVIN